MVHMLWIQFQDVTKFSPVCKGFIFTSIPFSLRFSLWSKRAQNPQKMSIKYWAISQPRVLHKPANIEFIVASMRINMSLGDCQVVTHVENARNTYYHWTDHRMHSNFRDRFHRMQYTTNITSCVGRFCSMRRGKTVIILVKISWEIFSRYFQISYMNPTRRNSHVFGTRIHVRYTVAINSVTEFPMCNSWNICAKILIISVLCYPTRLHLDVFDSSKIWAVILCNLARDPTWSVLLLQDSSRIWVETQYNLARDSTISVWILWGHKPGC